MQHNPLDDLSLAEARERLLDNEIMDPLLGLISLGRSVRIRFVRTRDERDIPDDISFRAFRLMASRGEAKLVIDDRGGGLYQREREPELT